MTGLNKQLMPLNLGQGIDTKTDSKLVIPGKMVRLENGVFKKKGRIDKRYGYELISGLTINGSVLEDGTALQTFNDELLQYNKQKLYSFSQGAEKWIDKGSVVSASVQSKQVVKNTASQNQADFATNAGVSVYAYEDSRGGIRASVYDEATGTPLVADMQIAASGERVKCLSFSFYLYVFYYNAGSLFVRRINPLTPTTIDAPVTVSSTVNTTTKLYDVVSLDGVRMCFVHAVQGANEIDIGFLNEEPMVLVGTLGVKTYTELAENCLTVFVGPNKTFFVGYQNNTDGVKAFIANNGGNQILAPAVLDSYIATPVRNITGFGERDLSGSTFFYEVSQTDTYNHFVKKNTLDFDGTVGTPTVWLRSVGLWSKAFSYYFASESVDHAYVCIVHASILQSTLFVARDDGLIVGKFQYSLASGLTNNTGLCGVSGLDSNTFAFAILNKTQLVSENDDVFSLQGVSQARIDFDAAEQFNALQLGDNLHITGGVLQMYDGQSVVEHGFHLYPENLSTASAGAGSINNGDYNYVAVYEWTDNFGLIHRSAPSIPILHTVSGGPDSVDVTIPTLRLTQKMGTRTNVSVVLYRTEAGPGAIYYRVSSVTAPTYNDTTVDTITITDDTTDADLISQEILYTTGGVLENIPPPSCKYIEQFKDRIILAGLENPNEIWTSKINFAGSPVEFNNLLTLYVPSQGGGVSALSVIDDKMLFFKRDRFFISFGDGPNNTGQGGEFAKPQFVSSDVGCDNNNSIVRFPGGIMFGSEKGIYVCDASLNTSYIGAEVEDYNNKTITSATLEAESNQVRFTTSEGPTLVYDYFFQQWSTASYAGKDSVIWNKKFVFIDKNGTCFIENNTFRDNGKGISLSMLTGWIAMDSIIGFQRVYKLLLVGQYKSYHKLRISVGYDFSETFESYYIMDTQDSLDIQTFGEKSPFGSDSPFGGESNAYRFAIGLDVQKCQAIRFKIEDLTVSSTPGSGEAFNITNIGLLVGIKGTPGKFKKELKVAST